MTNGKIAQKSAPAKKSNWLQAAGALWMLAFLVWLPFEDTKTSLALVLAAGACLWLGLRRLMHPHPTKWLRGLVAGALLGAATPLLAIVLMALKSGLHAHGFADFTLRQLWEVTSLVPIGAVAGSLAGIGAWAIAKRS